MLAKKNKGGNRRLTLASMGALLLPAISMLAGELPQNGTVSAVDGSFSTKLGSEGSNVNYTIIIELGDEGSNTGSDLQGIEGNLDGNYVLGSNIDASAASDWDGGFYPVALRLDEPSFTGILDGLGIPSIT